MILILVYLLFDVTKSQVTYSKVYTGPEIVDVLAGTWKNADELIRTEESLEEDTARGQG